MKKIIEMFETSAEKLAIEIMIRYDANKLQDTDFAAGL